MQWSQRPPAPRRGHRNSPHLAGSQPLQIALGGVPLKMVGPMDLDVDVSHNLAQNGRKLEQIPIYDVKFHFLLGALGPFGMQMGNHQTYPQFQRWLIW